MQPLLQWVSTPRLPKLNNYHVCVDDYVYWFDDITAMAEYMYGGVIHLGQTMVPLCAPRL